MDEAKFVSINIWHRHTACVYEIVFNICDRLKFLINIWYPREVWNNFLVEILWKLLGYRTYGQRVVSFADKFLFAFCFFVWQHYCNHVSICWFKLKLERFPKNPWLFLNKAAVPKAICCFAIVFFYPSTVCIMTDRVLRKILPQRICACMEKKRIGYDHIAVQSTKS